ncbi:BDNF/NT-3 growth factors receptor-like isoform X2 [Dysidea avara]|uniref:BDNF/NT-3 growth factors receptor-like isoform X2 n=1 Tax=Dysidea avara TaxID=196820 RepID=UPI0033341DCB
MADLSSHSNMMDNMMLLLLVLPLGAFSYSYDYLGRLFMDINCTTDHEAHTHTISIFWKLYPPANLSLTHQQILNRLADTRAFIECDSTNKTVANDYRIISEDISDKHLLSYEISTNYLYYEFCEVSVDYDDFDDPSQNFDITTTVEDCQFEVPSIVLSTPSNMSIQEGSTFNISFEYYAVPPPTFTWNINDEFYKTVDSTTSHGTHTVMFANASRGGWYQCVIENEFGSYNYTIFVEITGVNLLSTPSNMSVQEGSTFNISFEYYAVPPPNFTWYINDEFYETKIGTTNNGTHTVVFTNASQGGWYRCEIKNDFRTDEYSVFISIKGTPAPSVTSNSPSSSSTPGTSGTTNTSDSSLAAIIISIIVALIIFVFIIACLGVAIFKWRRAIFSTAMTRDREKEANYMVPAVDNDCH